MGIAMSLLQGIGLVLVTIEVIAIAWMAWCVASPEQDD
jgi:hypothetical protein